MTRRLEYSTRARKQLGKLDKAQALMIARWMAKNIDGCDDPRAHGKALRGQLSDFWRYRVGKYRVLCKLQDDELVVLAIEVGHRSAVYERR